MTTELFRALARRLNQTPNGFPSTESGVELAMLAKIFEPEEARLAAGMRLSPESAAGIAARAGVSAAEALPRLKTMARKGLVQVDRNGRELTFALMPFVVGFYEEQLPRLDRELAELVERYFQEVRGFAQTPVHRVLPVGEAVPFQLEVFPYESATALIEGAKAWGVRECICRVQQKLLEKDCGKPGRNCIVFAPVAGVFDHGTVTQGITKEEALRILREAEEAGLVHTAANHRDGHHYICNCCPCCCGVLRTLTEFQAPSAVVRSGFRAVVDPDTCAGCEDCLPHCPFGALAMEDGRCRVSDLRCLGCGQCISACTVGALKLERLPQAERPFLADDFRGWMDRVAGERGLDLTEIL